MSHIGDELDRVREHLLQTVPGDAMFWRLWSAQQALAWCAEPTTFASPTVGIMGTREDIEDCQPKSRLERFEDIALPDLESPQ